MSLFNKNNDFNKEEKQNLREFSRLNKTELIKIIYKLQDMNLAIKARNIELERMLEERGGLINNLSNTVGVLNNTLNKVSILENRQHMISQNKDMSFYSVF